MIEGRDLVAKHFPEFNSKQLDLLQAYVDAGRLSDVVDFDALVANRLAGKTELVKILGRGELKAKLKVSAHKFTATAKQAIEAAGGKIEE